MALAMASKGAPLAGLLKKLLATSSSSSSALRPASSAAATCTAAGGAPSSRQEVFGEDTVLYRRLREGAHPTAAYRLWVSKKDEKAVQLNVEMPGMAAEHVKVQTDPEGLFVKGEAGVKHPEDAAQDDTTWCSSSLLIRLSRDAFRLDQAHAVMKDGVLRLTVPRVKVDVAGDKSTEIKVRKG